MWTIIQITAVFLVSALFILPIEILAGRIGRIKGGPITNTRPFKSRMYAIVVLISVFTIMSVFVAYSKLLELKVMGWGYGLFLLCFMAKLFFWPKSFLNAKVEKGLRNAMLSL